MKGLISVIIPVYNVEKYLHRCINSVLYQSYNNIEIIVVDDGSTDNSYLILESLCQRYGNIKIIHQSNQGVTSARLAGIRIAMGDWIGFIDGDDEIDCDMYERLINNASQHEADISHCGYLVINKHKKIRKFYGTGNSILLDNKAGLCELLRGSLFEPSLNNKLYKKSLFDSILTGIINPNIRNYEDLLMNYYLFKRAKYSYFEDFCPSLP